MRFVKGPARRLVSILLLASLAATAAPAAVPPAPSGRTAAEELFDKSLKAAVEALRVYGRWDDPAQLRRVNEIGYRVVQESGFRDYPITFGLIDMPEPNAFALPAGQIFVTRGMLALGLTDDDLAALLGHEIAHVVHRHGVKIERRATLLNILGQALMLGVMIGASNSDPEYIPRDPLGRDRVPDSQGELIYGSYAASLILSELLLRSYSREFEDAADEDGQRWAAAAGFSPQGAVGLMETLGSRLPESREYGYWRTHPFFAQRLVAARARGAGITRGEARETAELRSWTQQRVLDLGSVQATGSDGALWVESAALASWPRGTEADRLRLARVHRQRDATLERIPLDRDYGALLARLDAELADVAALAPDSGLLATLREERAALARQADELYPTAQRTWQGGVYQTPFLEIFLSNWPQAPEVPEVALALGEAYGRTARQADAVAMFLRAADHPRAGAAGERAMRGLRTLAPGLDQLSALGELAAQQRDPELARLAAERLATLAGSYADLVGGATFLERFPDSPHVDTVAARLNVLAENLYGEVLLYQSVGDHVRAIDRIQKILTHAPASPAAQKLLDRAVLPT